MSNTKTLATLFCIQAVLFALVHTQSDSTVGDRTARVVDLKQSKLLGTTLYSGNSVLEGSGRSWWTIATQKLYEQDFSGEKFQFYEMRYDFLWERRGASKRTKMIFFVDPRSKTEVREVGKEEKKQKNGGKPISHQRSDFFDWKKFPDEENYQLNYAKHFTFNNAILSAKLKDKILAETGQQHHQISIELKQLKEAEYLQGMNSVLRWIYIFMAILVISFVLKFRKGLVGDDLNDYSISGRLFIVNLGFGSTNRRFEEYSTYAGANELLILYPTVLELLARIYLALTMVKNMKNQEVKFWKFEICSGILMVVLMIMSFKMDESILIALLYQVAVSIFRSFKERKNSASLDYTFVFILLCMCYNWMMLTLEAPYSLLPSNKEKVLQWIVIAGILYSIVLAQIFYHPRLFWGRNQIQGQQGFIDVKVKYY